MTATIELEAPAQDPYTANIPPRRPRRARSVRPRPPARPRPPVPTAPAVASTALLMLAALAAWTALQLLVLGALSENRAQQNLYADLRQTLARQTAPLGGEIEAGAPVALLEIPTLGVEDVVVEGTASGDLQAGPGHRRDTVLPGQAGISILYGKALTYGAPFRSVPSLRPGDGIQVTTAQGEYTYRVDGVRREGDPTLGALGDGEARLTLVTMEGTGALAAVSPTRTVYVDATLVGEAATGPARVAAIPAAEKALAVDPGVLPMLALVLQVLLLVVAATAWVRPRLPGRALWLIAVPPLVALAWLSVDSAAQLLPNLL